MSFLTITLILFLIMDPLGNIASLRRLMTGIEKRKQRWILTREMFIALGFMFVFHFLGEILFFILNITEVSVQLASGLILFITALQILFPTLNSFRKNLPKGEPFLIPLAIPLIAGPSLLATIMLFSHTEIDSWVMFGSIIVAWSAAYLILASSDSLYKVLGENGLFAFEKLMGMILILLAVQRFLDGIKQFLSSSA